uniref:Immunoglobulin I-set domain-containing protein n=1 Tax=Glossina pallidipes TaxID=7398 RepID=A0A1A9Z438_GLOPL
MINMYTWHLNLTIRHIMKSDFGAYSCSSVNALGKSEARIRLQELRLPPKPTTTPTPYIHTTATPRRKPPLNMNKDLNEVLPARNSYEKTHKTPPVVPSPRSPWVITNEAVAKLGSQRTVGVGTNLVVALCTFFYGSQIYAISTPN